MKAFDAHVHVGRWRIPEFANHASSVEELKAVYGRWSWHGALVCSTDEGDNRWILENVPDRDGDLVFRRAFWVEPAKPAGLSLLAETAAHWSALKLHPSLVRVPANDALLAPWYAQAAELRLPVLVHCGRWVEMSGYQLALDAAAKHPELSFILGHMGGDSPHLVRACARALRELGLKNCWLGTESIREPWLLHHAIDQLGPERLVFGSDYNLNHPEPGRRLLEVMDLPPDSLEAILYRNISGLLPAGKGLLP